MAYSYTPTDIDGFFKDNKVVPTMPPSFWWKAIPAASQMGFGIGKIKDNAITIFTPDHKKLVYKGLGMDSLTYLGIILTHAILTTKLHD